MYDKFYELLKKWETELEYLKSLTSGFSVYEEVRMSARELELETRIDELKEVLEGIE